MGARIKTTPGKLPRQITARNASAKKVTRRALGRAAHLGRRLMTKSTPVDQGQLKNSWKVRVWGGTIGDGTIAAKLTNDAPHAGIVEGGARPHPVSQQGVAAIYAWVWRNRQMFSLTTPGGKASSSKATRAAAMGIANAIAHRIRLKGQKPTYFVKNKMPQLHQIAINEVISALKKQANRKNRSDKK